MKNLNKKMVFNLPLKKNNDLVFMCRKCHHEVFLQEWWGDKEMKKMIRTDCPECGEEADENWILSRFDTFRGLSRTSCCN